MTLDDDLTARLAALEARALKRMRLVVDGPPGVELRVEGRQLVNFSSNDYLGLAAHPEVRAALVRGAERYGVGAGAAHLVTGHSRAHHELEQALAEFTDRPRALLFSTGYMANLGIVGALAGKGDLALEDELNHASLLDAGLLAGARFKRYAHGDAAAADVALAESDAKHKLLITDGVFSMDGDLAPLPALAAAATAHDATLVVDDAHGLGVLGRDGRGTLDHHGLGVAEVPVLMGTLGKAFGCFGAFVAGSTPLIEWLENRARSYIYTTASPPALAEAARAALALCVREGWRRERLTVLIARLRTGAAELGLPLLPSTTPIQPLLVGAAAAALAASQALRTDGLLVTAIRPPTVPEGGARLRITLSAAHSEAQVDRLLAALERLQPTLPAASMPP
jgi:8-amino-7-oxononanoate synthase